ncbi:hypothetical protein CLV81_3363 [Flagellimonas meridianipacifica]|uniref:Uncharacterized protein n=1 Tax=Flagellimonas meridianipacifica TaxID=1080225 RepID=A0A2T0MBT2_9FLAO|nr:hypothetical protein CLV81_3363 [Allomuricauda pacifica]
MIYTLKNPILIHCKEHLKLTYFRSKLKRGSIKATYFGTGLIYLYLAVHQKYI